MTISRLTLERRQVWVYLTAILIGLALGHFRPEAVSILEAVLWPLIGLLLYTTFVQVPLLHLADAFRDRRFTAALLLGNFILLPLLVWVLVQMLPPDPVLRLGVMLVLLVPCTDWFITFTQLGRGDVPRAIAAAPLNLLVQLLLLPVFLFLMADPVQTSTLSLTDTWPAVLLVLTPLTLAAMSERWVETRPERARVREALAWWPVPLLALVVLVVSATQVAAIAGATRQILIVVPVFVAFLVLSALIARGLAHTLRLPPEQGRTLAFSLGTRNSFVVLPLALALPVGWEAVAFVIVIQSLVELFGMLFYLWWVPNHLFR